jgi:hypothetical protein
MPSRRKRRKFEIHRLTISGLSDGTDYRKLINYIGDNTVSLKDAIWAHGDKTHAMEETFLRDDYLRLKFLSYKTGYRPDILDTEDFTIEPNPLRSNQAGIDYTHALLVPRGDQWLMVIEKIQGGIWPDTIALYFNWMLNTFPLPDGVPRDLVEEIIVSVEPEPGESFFRRIEELDRVTRATLRIVKPNPGWDDLENELGDEANESRAARADITMAASPRSSLAKRGGIIGRMRELFRLHRLGHAEISGTKGKTVDNFTTEQLGQKTQRTVQLDQNGQVISEDAYNQMERIINPPAPPV